MKAWRREPFDAVIADVSAGNEKVPQSEFLSQGRYAVVDQGKELVAGYSDDESRVCRAELPVIVFGDHTRSVKYVNFPFCMGADGVKVLRPKIDADVKYLYHYLRQLRITESGYDRHFKYLKRSSILLPPIAEQRRIAEILDKADALRAKRWATVVQLDTLTRSIFIDMFGDPVCHQVGSLVTVRDAIRKGSILEIQDGNHGERHPKIEDFGRTGIPFITANCLNDGELELTNCYFLPHAWIKRLRVGFAVSGDVLLSHKGSIGFTAIVPSRDEPVILSPQVTYYRPNPDSLLPQFLRAFFQTESFQAKMKKEAEQTTRSYLGITRQLELPLFLPAMELQQEFTRRTARIESLRKTEDASLKELNVLFGSLQHRAFRGEL